MIKTEIKNNEKSTVEITAELSAEEFSKYRPMALNALRQNVSVDGFRPGKAPDQVIAEKVGAERVLQEMADLAVRDWYPKVVEENKIDAIGSPQVVITKLADNNPLGFKVITAVYPEVKLSDYKQIASKIVKEAEKTKVVEDKDIDKAIEEMEKAMNASKKEGEDDKKLDDETVKKLGSYESLVDFKTKLKEKMQEDENRKATEKRRIKIIEEIGHEANPVIPDILLESELNKMIAEMEGQLSQNNLTIEGYLKHLNTTLEKLKEDWRPQAESRVRFGLIMEAIARAENITLDEKKVAEEMKKIKQIYPNLPDSHLRPHIEQMMTNEAIFEKLEK